MTDKSKRVAYPPGDLAAGSSWSVSGTDRLAQQIDHQRIATRAYELYRTRSPTEGSADDDWCRAEAEYLADRANERRSR
jgi:hypothetical protein